MVEKRPSQKIDKKLVAVIKEAKPTYSIEFKSNFIDKSVVAGLLGTKGDFELREYIIDN